MDEATDDNYTRAMAAAVQGGVNFIDTSLNYRNQHSELAIGRALQECRRDEIVVCTKAGYLVPGAVPESLRKEDVVAGMHCMSPAFLEDQLNRSLRNLGVEAVDVFYLHNPETQLRYVEPDTFYQRCGEAFAAMERFAQDGRLRYYGTATWDGYRRNGMADGLSLTRLASIAQDAGGAGHHFRFIQLPFNLGMSEAFGQKAESWNGERCGVMDAARELDITVIGSASLLQSRLTKDLPEQLIGVLGMQSDAGRALQFARSAPGIAVALAGMSQEDHVRENLQVAAHPPLDAGTFASLFGAA